MDVKATVNAYEILKAYNGLNNQILYLKKRCSNGQYELTEFDVKYILKNQDYTPKEVNKIVKISDLLGNKLKEEYTLDFTPEKIKIYKIIGELGNSFHCYIQFRQSIPPTLKYINKSHILTPIDKVEWENINVNFEQFDNICKNKNKKLKIHQKDGVKFLLGNKKCILADSMGLGKTTTSIIATLAANCKKILVICPATLKTNWRVEICDYVNPNDVQIINSNIWEDSKQFTIVNYEILKNFYVLPTEDAFERQIITDANGYRHEVDIPIMVKSKSNGKLVHKQVKSRKKDYILDCMSKSKLISENFDCIIIDEAQKLSNNTSNRYKVIEDLLKRSNSEYIFLLTGTPISNRPKNFYNILHLLQCDVTKDYEYYMKRYCEGRKIRLKTGKEIMLTNGASNLEELMERTKHLYIRRLATDVPDMVQKQLSTRYYDLNDEQKAKYEQLWSEYVSAQEERTEEETEEYRQLVEGGLVRKFLAKEMVTNTIALAEEIIEDDEKVVIVCTYQDELDLFKAYFKSKCVVYDGRITSAQKKDDAVYQFMNNPKIKVFIGNLNAAGTGITLTSASKMIFNSYSWEEINNRQMQDRIWRLTQTKDCECIYQLWTDSISQDMFEKVIYKGLIMDTVIKKESEK